MVTESSINPTFSKPGVWGFRGLGFRVWGGFGVEGLGLRVGINFLLTWDLGFKVWGLGLCLPSPNIELGVLGLKVCGLRLGLSFYKPGPR